MPRIRINGVERDIDAEAQMPLLWAIRDILRLTGTKFGCGIGACDACRVHLDGQAVRSCLTSLADAEGHEIVRIEGLSPDGSHPLQRAWEANNLPQCGYNTTIYGLDDRYRGVFGGRMVVFMNEADMRARGIAEGDMIVMESLSEDGKRRLVSGFWASPTISQLARSPPIILKHILRFLCAIMTPRAGRRRPSRYRFSFALSLRSRTARAQASPDSS